MAAMRSAVTIAALSLVAACASHGPLSRPRPPAARAAASTSGPRSPGGGLVAADGTETFYMPTPAGGDARRFSAPVLPIDASDLLAPETRPEGEAWSALLRDGIVITQPPDEYLSLGAFYTNMARAEVPLVFTQEAAFAVVTAAVDRAMADGEQRLLRPTLFSLLHRVDATLARAHDALSADLVEPLRVARGVNTVALSLLEPHHEAAPELVLSVAAELALIRKHAGLARSPLLGVSIDYGAFAPSRVEQASGPALAWTWLASAPLVISSRESSRLSRVLPSQARLLTRAAAWIAYATDPKIDPEAALELALLARAVRLLWGPADDVPLDALRAALWRDAGEAPSLASFASTVRIERARAKLVASSRLRIFDGGGSTNGVDDADELPPGALARGLASARVLGGAATPDAALLQSVVFPEVGAPKTPSASGRIRALPHAADVAAWLGSLEAADELRASGAASYEGYDAAIQRQRASYLARGEADRHESVHATLLSALALSVRPDAVVAPPSPPRARAALEGWLARWTLLRLLARPFERAPLDARRAPEESDLPPLAIVVEPSEATLVELGAGLAQLRRGLRALGADPPAASPGDRAIDGAERIVEALLSLATGDRRRSRVAPGSLIDELRAFEAQSGPVRPWGAAAVHSDVGSGKLRVSVDGRLVERWAIVRHPASGRATVAVGAHIPQREIDVAVSSPHHDAALLQQVSALPPARRALELYPRVARADDARKVP